MYASNEEKRKNNVTSSNAISYFTYNEMEKKNSFNVRFSLKIWEH